MKIYLLKIELKSDLCSGNGEGFGALIDNDVCYDSYGIPYIPGKRLKGCLRDSAAELANFGMYEKNEVENLFGVKGQNESSPLRVRDAYIENYEDIIYDIENEIEHKEYMSEANILEGFTYLRAQTAVEDTGIAKKHSLRYTRVVKKGICFYAEIKTENENYLELLENSAKNLRSIGLSRNRGFGEVKVSVIKRPENNDQPNVFKTDIQDDEKIYDLKYILKLKTPLILAGSGDETETYIPGGSVMGYFANHIEKKEDFEIKKFLDGSIIFSNAYISAGETHVYYPAPAYIKINKYGGDTAFGNLTDSDKYEADPENMVKTESLNGRYCRFEKNYIYIKSVDTDINYHLFRIENSEDDEGNFFQYTSIREGQTFAGHIIAPGSYIKKFIEHINDKGEITLGKSKTAQYGVCDIKITDCRLKEESVGAKSSKFAVVLRSPLILCTKNGMFSPDLKELVSLLKEKLNIECNIIKQYTKVKSVGGYNVAWNLPKQQISAFDVGSALVLETEPDKPIELSIINNIRFGERINEGFGEMFAFDYNEAASSYEIKKAPISDSPKTQIKKSDIVQKIVQRITENQWEKTAIENALKSAKAKDINSPTIGRLILMLKESENRESFNKTVKAIKDQDKKEKIEALLNQTAKNIPEEYFKIYMRTFLHQLKLLKRTEKFNETKNGSGG